MLYKEEIKKILIQWEQDIESHAERVANIKLNYANNRMQNALFEEATAIKTKKQAYKDTVTEMLANRRKDFENTLKLNSSDLDEKALTLCELARDEKELEAIAEGATYTTLRAINAKLADKPYKVHLLQEDNLKRFDIFASNTIYLFNADVDRNARATLKSVTNDIDNFIKTAE